MSLSETLPARPARLTGVLSSRTLIHLFFFISGMPALSYQLAWQRVLFRVFGVNMESVTVVVTAFMLGLGIGSLVGSRIAVRRTLQPLLLIAVIELCVGLFGLVSIGLFDWADHFVQGFSLFAKALSAIGLVFVPTTLMGMTLPLLVGYLISRSANVGLSTGSLYRANTLGAAAGCAISALVLFPFLGLQATIWVAAATNATIGVAALAAFAILGDRNASQDVARARSAALAKPLLSFPVSLSLMFFGGFVSLSYEIFLFRIASFASGTNALALALVLSAFLVGVASGAQQAAQWCAEESKIDALPIRIFKLLVLTGLFGLLILPILNASAFLGDGLIGIIALAAFVVARSLGILFPLVAHFAVAPGQHSGGHIGLLYLSNILGSATGSMLTGFVISNLLGSRELAILLSLLVFCTSVPFVRLHVAGAKRSWLILGAAAAAAGLLIAFQAPLTARLFDHLLYKQKSHARPAITQVVENRDGIITVDSEGTVYGNGIYDGSFNVDLFHGTNGIIRPYGLSLYHPAPRKVLMIGLASGSWAQVIANNPDVVHLTIVEINPGYIPLIRQRPQIRSVLNNPKVTIVIDDGRRWLKTHAVERFDAIFANTSYHFRANASNVLSVEFDDLIKRHLNPGGVYFFNPTASPRVEKTGCAHFRFGYRVLNHVLLSDAPIVLDTARWRRNLERYRMDGRQVFDPGLSRDAAALKYIPQLAAGADLIDANSAKRPMESCRSLLGRVGGAQAVTDDNMGTEWRYPLGLD